MKTKIKIHYYINRTFKDGEVVLETFKDKKSFKIVFDNLKTILKLYSVKKFKVETGKVIIDDEGLRTFPETKNQKDIKDLIKYFKANKDIYDLEICK